MFPLCEVRFPRLFPLSLLGLHDWTIRDDVEGEEIFWMIQRDPKGDIVISDPEFLEGVDWSISRNSLGAYKLLEANTFWFPSRMDVVTIGPRLVTYAGLRRMPWRKRKRSVFIAKVSFPKRQPNERGALSMEWTFLLERQLSATRDDNIIADWRKISRGHKRLLRVLQLLAIDHFIPQDQRATIERALERLAALVPAIAPFREAFQHQPSFSIAQMQEMRALLAVELPPDRRELIAAPPDELCAAEATVDERLTVRHHTGADGERGRITLTVRSATGPSERSKAGFSFLHDILGEVPNRAMQNTGGQELTFTVETLSNPVVFHLGVLNAYDLAKMVSAYAVAFDVARGPLDQMLERIEREVPSDATETYRLVRTPRP